MCECLDDAWTCACCGSQVEIQEFEGEPRLMHFLDHEESEVEGVVNSVWQLHDRESCKFLRLEHWKLLVRGGIAAESV